MINRRVSTLHFSANSSENNRTPVVLEHLCSTLSLLSQPAPTVTDLRSHVLSVPVPRLAVPEPAAHGAVPGRDAHHPIQHVRVPGVRAAGGGRQPVRAAGVAAGRAAAPTAALSGRAARTRLAARHHVLGAQNTQRQYVQGKTLGGLGKTRTATMQRVWCARSDPNRVPVTSGRSEIRQAIFCFVWERQERSFTYSLKYLCVYVLLLVSKKKLASNLLSTHGLYRYVIKMKKNRTEH